MSEPKRHHFVSEFLLKKFADKRGRLFVFDRDRPELGIRDPVPSEVLHQRHFYSTVNDAGVKCAAFEKELSVLETSASAVIEQIIAAARAGTTPDLDTDQRDTWDEFFAMQWRRVPDAQRLSPILLNPEEAVREVIAKARSRYPDRAEEIERLSRPENVRLMARNSRIEALRRPARLVRSALAGRGLAILRILPAHKSFITGSFPVVKLCWPGRTDLRDTDVEMWLPIAHDVAVGVGLAAGTEMYIALSDTAQIRHLNMSVARQSRVIVGRSREHIHSIAQALPALPSKLAS